MSDPQALLSVSDLSVNIAGRKSVTEILHGVSVDLMTGENPVLGPDNCFGYRFDPCPVLGLGEGLLATVPVAVPE